MIEIFGLQRELLGKFVLCADNYHNKNDQINQTINLIVKIVYLIKERQKILSACLENANLRIC